MLYDGVTQKLSDHLDALAHRLSQAPDSTLLEEVGQSFSAHVVTMNMIRDILMYMDRTYVVNNQKRPVYELGMYLYRIIVWERDQIRNRVSSLLLQAIMDERSGMLTDDRTLLKSVLSMLQQLGAADNSNVYERDFDEVFLGTTQEFYEKESSLYLAENSASDYVTKAKMRLEEERNRATALGLPPTTQEQLKLILDVELIKNHAKTLVTMDNSGFGVLLKDESKVEVMKDMFDLFSRVPSSVQYLRDSLCQQITFDGKALISEQERGVSDPPSFVRGVLKMNKKYSTYADVAFRGELIAKKRLKESFESFLNADVRAAQWLAIYADDLLRSGLKGASEDETNNLLRNIILVFRYISDKDVFENFYKELLAKRLLTGRSVSDEAEKSIVSMLKAECGYQFTSKLEGMFNDMRISRDTRDAYKSHQRNTQDKKSDIVLDVSVLTAGYWPSQNVPMCIVPHSVQSTIDHFENFYLTMHSGRKLSFQTSTGTAEIKVTFGAPPKQRPYDLIVSTYQMCILMLFNDKDTLTFNEIMDATNIPDIQLRRHLISLSTPKHRILRKGSKGKGFSGDDESFTLNDDYKSNMRRVKIPLVNLKEALNTVPVPLNTNASSDDIISDSTNSELPLLVEEERRHLVEAATVRIMKARKQLQHNDLIAEVTKQLSSRFIPTPQFIKKRIEGLIEREYIERSEGDHRLYTYVA